ncbi:MAG TPA: HAMP domain-containing sensor histidine kinase [Hyphomonadaceae bacterium]|jgi:signal transduction histidine kinase|nr:HAMP domain-containing sensor histidine kinase [Hyphomonadaceae bacterium]
MSEPDNPKVWIRTFALSIVAAVTALVVVTAVAAVWFVESRSRDLFLQQYSRQLDETLNLLQDSSTEEGRDGLLRSIGRRADAYPTEYCAARDASGKVVAGDVAAWPDGLGSDVRLLQTRIGPDSHDVVLASRRIGDIDVMIGMDNDALFQLQKQVLGFVWIAGAVLIAMSVAIAGMLTAYVLRRVDAVAMSAERVLNGDYSARLDNDAGGPFGAISLALNRMLRHNERLILSLRAVTDSLAHDLRPPLTRAREAVVRGAASNDADVMRNALDQATVQIDRAMTSFSSLIEIARMQGENSKVATTRIDISELLTDAAEHFEPVAEERGVQLTVKAALISVSGLKPILMQAVINLIDNALKHAPRGSSVEAGAYGEDETIVIYVSDSGPGIPAGMQDSVVKRFVRGPADGEDVVQGLGLGLAIVQACAQLHDGRLELLDNTPGLNARIVLRNSASTGVAP